MSPGRDDRERKDGGTPGGALRIGVLSDTHGYLDPNILDAFAGVDLILHAGDVGDAEILDTLRTVAPVTAVAGNLDGDGMDLPTEVAGEVGDVRFALGHKRKRLTKRLLSASDKKFDLVVFGHEHVPTASWMDGTLWLNPGSASAPYEEDDGPTVAVVERVQAGPMVCLIPVGRRELQLSPSSTKSAAKAKVSHS